jgi:ubiquinone/menaquinone biosynthesis C-methylase UbiE
MRDEMARWESEDGVEFLKKVGLRTGQTVLDFGARIGHYSIPAAIAVGKSGLIYAMDKEQESLDELNRKAMSFGLTNLKAVRTSGETALDLKSDSVDVALFYDVLHYFNVSDRKKLYHEIFRILRYDGILSVYPKHVREDSPSNEFEKLCAKDVIEEIEDSDFIFHVKYYDTISHDDFLIQGCVYNFIKRNPNKTALK